MNTPDTEFEKIVNELYLITQSDPNRAYLRCWVDNLITSRDTYWQQHERDMYESLDKEYQLQIEHAEKKRDTYWKERVRKEVEAEIRLFMETMQKRADTVPPQLLLNEVVNYAYDRLQALDNLK